MGCLKLSYPQTTGLKLISPKRELTSKKSENNVRSNYMFGFNGQMKVNEIAGVGNHNTALFWEYDTRLGRRWNLDPVDQVNISNYAVNGLNPIVNIDPLGNHHYYNNNGSYNSSDKKTDINGNDITYVRVGEKWLGLNKISLETYKSRQAVVNVMGDLAHRYSGVNYSGRGEENTKGSLSIRKDPERVNKGVLAYTAGKDIKYLFSDKTLKTANTWDIVSTFDHENFHKNDANTGKITFISHSKVYLKQVSSGNFSKTSKEYQLGIAARMSQYLLNAYVQDQADIEPIIEDFNKNNKADLKMDFKMGMGSPINSTISISKGAQDYEPIKYKKQENAN